MSCCSQRVCEHRGRRSSLVRHPAQVFRTTPASWWKQLRASAPELFSFVDLGLPARPPRRTMANKEAAVAELTESFRSSNAVLLTEYRGLTVAQLKELRNSI